MANRSLAKAPEDLTILVTGGAGFIGSHTVVELLQRGFNVVIFDDLSNSSPVAVDRVRQITGVAADDPRLTFMEGSILDRAALEEVFSAFPIDAIIHFAGFKAVGESVEKPLEYYWNNIAGTLVLLEVARQHDVKNIVFSSSATVYGEPDEMPLTENAPKHDATNPYGQTKSMLEQILTDMWVGDNEWNVVLLRYFNPIGAHESGLIGEDPKGIPNNLLPYVAQVAVGKLPQLRVFGDDYPTPDGTGVRDYIHVVDLARGHVAALDWMGGKLGSDTNVSHETSNAAETVDTAATSDAADARTDANASLDRCSHAGTPMADGTRSGVGVFNLGTGRGSSVLDVVRAFEKASGQKIPYTIEPRRAGDIAENYAACDKALTELNWRAEYDLDRMCADSWRWQSTNPEGYGAPLA
ncbi:UDP-glucose 4-epimerase GalE [Adlercreutzia murintestinalis]|uniref:UDP-glucose 4-epimerase GalE n=1 Tax=Adlercreutzia murintestinalis TaxID=2941325 RepID=UPI002040C662|nr:UDP-glucose 4-epimerase GalE [Adlercreutzia murintestinalis]